MALCLQRVTVSCDISMLNNCFIIRTVSGEGMAQVTARKAAIATVSFENFILFQQKGIAKPSTLIASIGSLAILKVFPGKGRLILCVHFLFPLALCRLHRSR